MTAHRFDVLFTHGAERGLESLVDHIAEFDAPENGDYVLEQLLALAQGLAEQPERGSHPKELLTLGIREYRQLFFKSYRMIYRVMGQQVFIYLIADGRREMQALLERRLLG